MIIFLLSAMGVIAGLARLLTHLPSDYPGRKKFEQQYREMVHKLLRIQLCANVNEEGRLGFVQQYMPPGLFCWRENKCMICYGGDGGITPLRLCTSCSNPRYPFQSMPV